MDSLIKPQIIIHQEKSLEYTIYDVKWMPASSKFAVIGGKSNGSGIVQIYRLTGESLEKVLEFDKAAHFKCATFDTSSIAQRHLATGDFNGRLQIFDLEDTLMPVYKTTKHKSIINAIDGVSGTLCKGAPEIATGSKDGSVLLWDVRQKDEPVAQFLSTESDQARDCWCLAFGNVHSEQDRMIAAGYDNGDLKMYDLRAMKLRWSKNLKNGVVSVEFDRKDIEMNKLVATTLESKIFCFDLRTQHPKNGFAHLTEKAHKSTIWQAKHMPQNREVFMTTAGAGSLCLWKYNYPDKRVEKDGDGIPIGVVGSLQLIQNSTLSSQPITGFDWCKDKTGLAVCSSFDQNVRVLITTKLNLI